jgi:hypothetical protein
MHSFREGLNHWSMDLDAAPLPLLYNSRHERLWKNKYKIKLMPNFSTHILQTININAHLTHTSNMKAACKPHRHCKHTLSMHSSRGGLNHWSMDLDAAPLPLLFHSCREFWEKINTYTIKLMPYFCRHTHRKLTTCMQHAHFTHTPNMHSACKPHTHFKHALSMPYDGHTHTTSEINVRIHAPQCRGCEHACMHLCGCVGVACMHAAFDMPICMVCKHPAYIHAGRGRVLCQCLLQNCPTL